MIMIVNQLFQLCNILAELFQELINLTSNILNIASFCSLVLKVPDIIDKYVKFSTKNKIKQILSAHPPLVDDIFAVIFRIIYQHKTTPLQSLISGSLLF